VREASLCTNKAVKEAVAMGLFPQGAGTCRSQEQSNGRQLKYKLSGEGSLNTNSTISITCLYKHHPTFKDNEKTPNNPKQPTVGHIKYPEASPHEPGPRAPGRERDGVILKPLFIIFGMYSGFHVQIVTFLFLVCS
jgi:hypothetical protein